MKFIQLITMIFLIMGGLNWLFVAFDFNFVTAVFGKTPEAIALAYWLIGLSAIYQLYFQFLRNKL
ncbi:DUF378 domain-containing protein [Priestia megaterium]|nr:DUF378 domain-containing protein [Priestia megaterium]